jgi:hypothetical protein
MGLPVVLTSDLFKKASAVFRRISIKAVLCSPLALRQFAAMKRTWEYRAIVRTSTKGRLSRHHLPQRNMRRHPKCAAASAARDVLL